MQVASFDSYAELYDEHFTFSPIGLLQREMVYSHLIPLLNKEKNVLELNCGTGYDAFEIAKQVNSILATDVSTKMIEQCRAKKQEEKTHNIDFEKKSIQSLEPELKNKNFIFSNFGGLNCISPNDLNELSAKCNLLLEKEADLFFVIMGRKCIWERLYFTLKFRKKEANRRKLTQGVNAHNNDTEFKIWYYSPKEIQQIFGPNFKTQTLAGVGLFVPPSYLNPFFRNKKALLSLFNGLDKLFCKFKWTADHADHYIVHLKKVN